MNEIHYCYYTLAVAIIFFIITVIDIIINSTMTNNTNTTRLLRIPTNVGQQSKLDKMMTVEEGMALAAVLHYFVVSHVKSAISSVPNNCQRIDKDRIAGELRWSFQMKSGW